MLGVVLTLVCALPAVAAPTPTITEFSKGFTASDDLQGITGGPDGNGPLVFHWTGSTKIAE